MHGFNYREPQIPRSRFNEPGRFGRMFPWLRGLKAFKPGPDDLGAVGGPMDGGNPPPQDTSQNNRRIRAGYTFLGQFIDHDLTLDTTSILERQVDVDGTTNFRTPALELDSIYGLGPAVQPYLYDQPQGGKLLISADGNDLQRNGQGRAIIGDPRNDENILISQMQLLFIKFHNMVYDTEFADMPHGRGRFEAAQTFVRWHYQWLVMNEFLPRIVGTKRAAATIANPPFEFSTEHAYMPIEFSVAAYRFGHSQVRPGYLVGQNRGAGLFPGEPDAPFGAGDLRGFRPVPPELLVDWAFFFGPGGPPSSGQDSKKIDTLLSTVLLKLPTGVVPKDVADRHRSLATRNLQRGIDMNLPSGQTVACHLGIKPLTDAQIWTTKGATIGSGPAPLWFYCLREGEVRTGGARLSGVGAAIVARTFVALMLKDKASYMVQEPGFVPKLGKGGRFTMSDLVNYTLGSNLASEDLFALPGDNIVKPS
jgi:Animal haem peroxidase